MVALQQHIRQELTDVIQQVRMEMIEIVTGGMEMRNNINTSWQNVSTKSFNSKSQRFSDLIPESWDKGECRHFMSDLHFWMQTWSNEGEAMLSGVDSSDNYDISVSTVGSPLAESRTIETSLCQIPHQTTANDVLGTVQQMNGQKKRDMQS